MEEKFVNAAVNCRKAGIDGVELHAAHGYLLSAFLSPYTNHRTDRYGGTPENRRRIVTEIIAGIRGACGAYPICVRMNADDFVEGGITPESAVETAKILEAAGADALNVSCGVYESAPDMIEPNYYEEGWRKELGRRIRANVSIPVISVNTIKYPQTAERLLEEGCCDFAGVARGQMADPEWVNKAKAGREDLIRKCMGCMECNKSVVLDGCLSCAANPVTGRGTMYGEEFLIRNGNGRTVAVLGGGPAGMQAALVLAKRGFRVVLLEKAEALGGLARLAALPPHKTMVSILRESGVRLLPNHTLTGVRGGEIVMARTGGGEAVLASDDVVLAAGRRPDPRLYEEMAAAFDRVVSVGECAAVGGILEATRSANDNVWFLLA